MYHNYKNDYNDLNLILLNYTGYYLSNHCSMNLSIEESLKSFVADDAVQEEKPGLRHLLSSLSTKVSNPSPLAVKA